MFCLLKIVIAHSVDNFHKSFRKQTSKSRRKDKPAGTQIQPFPGAIGSKNELLVLLLVLQVADDYNDFETA